MLAESLLNLAKSYGASNKPSVGEYCDEGGLVDLSNPRNETLEVTHLAAFEYVEHFHFERLAITAA